jgi:carbonic anhydrase
MRHALTTAVVIGLGLGLLTVVDRGDASSERAMAVSPTTPQAAIEALLAGNERYVTDTAKSHNPPSARAGLSAGQAPFAAIIRCADSRVAPEIVFDQSLGELFVCAVAGNVPTPEIVASLEYGVAVLGTKLIVVMGHSSCGAVSAAIEHRDDTSVLPGSLPMLIDQIVVPCAINVDPADPNALHDATVCNARQGADELLKRSSVIKDAVAKGDLKIISGVQNLNTGRFEINGR